MKRRTIVLAILFVAVVAASLCYIYGSRNDAPYTIKNGMIHFAEPERAESECAAETPEQK